MGKNKDKGKTYKLNETKGTHQPNMIHGHCLDFNSDISIKKSYKAIRKM